jgi:hypothetical protein
MVRKYDKYVSHPPYTQMTMKADNSVIFNGLFVTKQQLGYDFKIGHQIVTRPFKGDNPPHIHNHQEFLAWYGTNPDDPLDFGGSEVVFFLGKELEKYVITSPTVISLPPGLVHCPMEITKIVRPIIQIEIMLAPPDDSEPTREPYFEKDKNFKPSNVMNIKVTPQKEYVK